MTEAPIAERMEDVALRWILAREAQISQQLEREVEAVKVAAREYAAHLTAGGDPLDHPELSRSGALVEVGSALQKVYDVWNAARGRARNTESPIARRYDAKKTWKLAEWALDRIGEPITYQEAVAVWTEPTADERWPSRKPDPDTVVRTLARLQGDDLVLRKGKVDGKVAYLLRERADGETPVAETVWAGDVPQEKF